MPRSPLTAPVLERLALRFKALGEPNRLAILAVLLEGERTVGELVQETGLGQANVSKHLLLLHRQGFLDRRKQGLNVYYRLTDDDVFHICDIMCAGLEREARELGGLLSTQRERRN